MRAALYDRYGPPEVLRIAEVEKPTPGAGDVLIRVHASTVCAADWRLRAAEPAFARLFAGLWWPKRPILGFEFAGVVEAVGEDVTRFSPGQAVFGSTGGVCGAHADYVCLPETGLIAARPANMSFEESAAVAFGGVSALFFLRRAGVRPGQGVLVYGASGSVGVFAVQLARQMGARVTAVCSTANLDLARRLGAEEVIDYLRQDFTASGPVYDVVFDTVGKSRLRRALRVLKPGGVFVTAMAGPDVLLGGLVCRLTGRARVRGGLARGDAQTIAYLAGLIEQGALTTVIDRSYPLEEIAAAHRHAQGGHKKGHVVVRLAA